MDRRESRSERHRVGADATERVAQAIARRSDNGKLRNKTFPFWELMEASFMSDSASGQPIHIPDEHLDEEAEDHGHNQEVDGDRASCTPGPSGLSRAEIIKRRRSSSVDTPGAERAVAKGGKADHLLGPNTVLSEGMIEGGERISEGMAVTADALRSGLERLAHAMSEARAADREEERQREQFILMLHGVAATLDPVAYGDLLLFAEEKPLSRLIVSFLRVPEHLAEQRNMLFSMILAAARASSAGQQQPRFPLPPQAGGSGAHDCS